jgi:hypothetical protein
VRHPGTRDSIPELTHAQWARIDAVAVALGSRAREDLTEADGPAGNET